MGYSPLSWLHVATAVAAMAAGLGVVLMRKGTRVHRRVGYLYVVSMVALNVSSFFIFSLTGRFSPFHVASMFSLTILVAGFLPVLLRRPQGGWLRLHMEFMVWSYIGLLAAAVSEAAVRIPETPFWWSVAGGTAVVVVTGALIWAHNRPRLLAQFMRRQG